MAARDGSGRAITSWEETLPCGASWCGRTTKPVLETKIELAVMSLFRGLRVEKRRVLGSGDWKFGQWWRCGTRERSPKISALRHDAESGPGKYVCR